jgi:hypothetical protein
MGGRARGHPAVGGPVRADLPLTANVTLVGPVTEVVDRHHYVTQTAIE